MSPKRVHIGFERQCGILGERRLWAWLRCVLALSPGSSGADTSFLTFIVFICIKAKCLCLLGVLKDRIVRQALCTHRTQWMQCKRLHMTIWLLPCSLLQWVVSFSSSWLTSYPFFEAKLKTLFQWSVTHVTLSESNQFTGCLLSLALFFTTHLAFAVSFHVSLMSCLLRWAVTLMGSTPNSLQWVLLVSRTECFQGDA